MTSSPHVFVEVTRQKMSGHPVATFHRGLTRRPPSFCVVSMDAGDRMHEVSRLVDCLVLVPGSNEPIVRCPFIAPYSAAGYNVRLNDGYKVGMCGMDFSSSVRFRFGFDKNRGFGSVSVRF